MQFNAKQRLISVGIMASLAFAGNTHATTPFDQIKQDIDKYQQSSKEQANEVERRANRHVHGDQANNHHAEHEASGSCRDERNLRSVQGNAHTTMKFLNNTNQEVRSYWLDYSGRRVFYKAIPPHGQYTQPTFQTHPWVVTDQRDNCIEIFVSNQPSAIAEIR